MIRRELTTTIGVVAVVAGLVAAGLTGCASGPDEEDSAPEEVVGQPPDEESEDFEFAPPPSHPGEHGDVDGPAGDESGDVETSPDPDVVTEAEIEELQRFGPSVVMQHVDAQPAYDGDDEFVGFELVEASETAREYLEPKLQVGDVITHVNLVRLEQPDDYMEAWDSLEGADEVRIDVVRDGDDREVVWEVE